MTSLPQGTIPIHAFFNAAEAAKFLRFSPVSLAIWRSEGRGPAYVKMGRSVRYRPLDLMAWGTADNASRKLLEATYDCHAVRNGKAKRTRGRAGAAKRAQRLIAEPKCRDCLVRASEEIDHIIPISQGGSDEDSNIRCLCKGCHAARTREQFRAV